ncbi:MAG: hypothetical protein V1490_03015, partial [Candidatus Omnitrophota bacterium]
LKPDFVGIIKQQQARISLTIEVGITGKPIPALAKITWIQELCVLTNKYFIGLSYEQIDVKQNSKIMRYVWTKKLFAPIALSFIILLALGIAANSFINIKLIKGNKALVEQLVKIIQDSSIAKQKIKEITKQSQDLQLKIQALQSRIETVKEEKEELAQKVKQEERRSVQRTEQLNNLIEELTNDKTSMLEQLMGLKRQEGIIAEDLLRLDKKKSTLEKANLDKMYQWLKIHQNPKTGLVMSFEGDSDIENWAFIYDQALVAQAYAYFSDFERAKKIFNFFATKAKRSEGLFFNAYYASDGEPAEYVVHSGPNIWLGIAILEYTKMANDTQYLKLAKEIAQSVISFQRQDKDGYIRGGPSLSWVSTEHNLDAYAFFKMLYKVTGDAAYLEAQDKVLSWLVQHTYDNKDLPVKRGKGDSTIATDTYAWSLAAIGPEKLTELGMNPDRIIEFAEQNCSVEVNYARPEGKTVKIKGFDFSASRNVARGGVVSAEWSAQMVISFKIMADFYYKKGLKAKAHAYEMKADEYMAQLGNMIISSPSPSGQGESCLPYATEDSVDTGHGWKTPKGKSTGSLAATTYTIFAYYNYNPLELKE